MSRSREHHARWLEAHPERSKEWLSERLVDGFDVHHLNGDHDDNDPNNLVLIEHSDHMMVHRERINVRKAARDGMKEKTERRRLEKLKEAAEKKKRRLEERAAADVRKAKYAEFLANRRRAFDAIYAALSAGYSKEQVFKTIDPSLYESPVGMLMSAIGNAKRMGLPWPPRKKAIKET